MKRTLFVLFLLLLICSGCNTSKKTTTDNSSDSSFSFESVSNDEKSNDKSFSFSKQNLTFTTTNSKFSNFEFQSLKDMDDNNGLFIYSDFENTSSEELIPDSIWQQYFSISKDESGIQDSLYQTVLPQKLLEKSDYKDAVDASLSSVKKDETVRVGFFYRSDGKELKMTMFDDDRDIVAIINKIK